MEPLAISWLVTSACAPLIAVLALWTIYVFHTYRRRWRTVDLFLLTICCQELVVCIFTFCYSIISLIIPPFQAPCNFTQWGLISIRTFQIATLTSMVVDRALTVRWPYRYRFSVRRNQIRYHIGVLALVSVLVGVAAVFARVDIVNSKNCYLHPSQWDVRYVVFLLSLYGVLIVVTFICMIQVEIHRSRHGLKTTANGSFQLPECASPDLPSATGMNSPLDTQSSTGSTRALHRPTRQASRRPYGKNNKSTSDLRWPSVALTTLLCFSVNHIPNLVLLSMAAYYPYLWSPWHEGILSWLGLLEGMVIPLLLFCKDQALRAGLRRAFQRRSGALSPLVGDDGPFQMYFDKDHFRKRGTFGSVTPIGIITNYRRTPGKKRRRTRNNSNAKYTLPGLHSGDSVLAKSCLSAGGYLGKEPLSKLSCADLTSLEMWREEDEENFYATLSDDFSTFSCKSADDSALSEDLRINEELYGGSFTTVANDDFEFHDTRPCGGEVKMKPALSTTPPSNNSFRGGGFSRNVSFKDDMLKKEIAKKYHEPLQNIFNYSNTNDTEDDHKDPEIFILPPKEWKNKEPGDLLSPSPETSPVKIPNPPNIIACYQKNTSFSMNDLDLIHKKPNVVNDVEATFIFPVKSESTMSLYRLNVERDLDQMAMTPSRSETDVNGDSGFGSGAQSTNPVWSGFLCRKPSDPFWNIRKPSTHTPAAVTPTRNYPGVLHPRMRKIPWISAWKKLDENSNRSERNQDVNTPKNENSLNWTENMVYEGKQTNEISKTCVSTIDEELSDINSPALDDPDYNLNIFAKESGVVLENAYGKIVRDDCGVQVNFYGKSVQYDIKDSANGNVSPNNNPFEKIFNFESNIQEQKTFNFPLPIINSSANINDKLTDDHKASKPTPQIDENISQPKIDSKNEVHYENLFGTKENIFAHCEQYNDKYQPSAISEIVGQPDEKPISNVNIFCQKPADHSYGQVKKVERKDSGNQKSCEKKQNIRYQDLNRRESDSKYTNKNTIKRRESRSRSNTRSSSDRSNQSHFNLLDNKPEITRSKDKSDGERKVEIEMKNVPSKDDLKYEYRFDKTPNKIASPRNFNRLGSQSRKPVRKITDPSRWKLEQPNFKKHINGISHPPNKIPRRISSSSKTDSVHDKDQPEMMNCLDEQNSFSQNEAAFKSKNAYVNVERKNSDRKIVEPKDYSYGVVKGAERSNKVSYNKNDVPKSKICRRDSSSKKNETKNEGLWVNAVPFQDHALNCERDEENGNLPKNFIENHPLRRSPRKSHLPRRESKSRNDRPNLQLRQKVYNNRKKGDKADHQQPNEFTSELMNESDEKRTLLQQESSIDSNFDDFFKYRNKCEDNFSKIQNLNSEASAERDRGLEDPFSFRRKLNGNIPSGNDAYPFEENGRLQFYANSKTEFDDNENCKQEKLAITDFL